MTYTDITSDGGMDPRNVAHHRVMVEAANTEAEIRAKLIDMGWRPPTKPINQPQVPTKAWLHATSDTCVTTDPTGYDKGRPLVLQADVRDHVERLEAGINEWRHEAETNRHHAAAARATAAIAIGHLQAMLNTQRTATQSQDARRAAYQWLASIGGEPT